MYDLFMPATIGVILIFVLGIVFAILYHRSTRDEAFVRTGLGGKKVVLDGGAVVLPVFHSIARVNLKTLRLQVERSKKDSLITKDRMRVDIDAEFYVRVRPDIDSIALAAQTLGALTNNAEALRDQVEAKFVDGLRSVAATMELLDLQEKRSDFVKHVQASVEADVQSNGLELEAVSLTKLDQTDLSFFNADNFFDAEGLTRLKTITETKRRDRNAIVPIRMGDRTVEAPGSPFHLTRTPPDFGGTVPELGEHDGAIAPRQAPAPTATKSRPLEGLRIVDLSMGWAGPICTRNLADLGADVIKIEACGYPDWWRGVDNRLDTVTQRLYEKSSRFNIMNRGKRAITLDLTVPDGVALAKALVKDADAVIENYSAEVLRKFGLDYAELAKVNPSLVMVSMAAFGASGPWRETRAYGSTLEQGSGLPSVGGRAQDPPMMNHLAYGDAVGGLNACSAMLVALLHRRETGEGQFIDLSQVQCMLPFTAAWAIEQSANGHVAPRAGNRHPLFVPHGVFPSAGTDRWVSIAVTDDAMWPALARLIGLDDPALANASGRRANEDRIEATIAAWTSARSPDEAMEILQKAGVAAGAVRHPMELLDDTHLKARGFWQWIERAYVGRHPQPSPPYRDEASPIAVRTPAATLGQYNEEVLGGLLGLSKSELERLARDSVIGSEALPANQRKARAMTG